MEELNNIVNEEMAADVVTEEVVKTGGLSTLKKVGLAGLIVGGISILAYKWNKRRKAKKAEKEQVKTTCTDDDCMPDPIFDEDGNPIEK